MKDRRLFIILAVALGLRVFGASWGLPFLYHQDEPIIVNRALAIGTDGWNTGAYIPPQFASYALFIVYAAVFLAGKLTGAFPSAEAMALDFLRDPTLWYVTGRLFLGAAFGTAAVFALYRLTERAHSKSAALWASAILAVEFLHVQHSHYIYTDSALTLAVVVTFASVLRYGQAPTPRNAALTGASLGWAISVKYTAAYFAPVLGAAMLLWAFGRKPAGRTAGDAAAAALSCVGVYALISPYTFLDWQNFVSQIRHQSAATGAMGWGHHLHYSFRASENLPWLGAGACGFAILWRTRPAQALVLTAGALVYYAVNARFSQGFARYALPLVPFICLSAGVAMQALFASRIAPNAKRALATLFFAALAAPTVISNLFFLTTDTRTECVRWFEREVPAGAVVALDNRFFGPPLTQSAALIKDKLAGAPDGPRSARTRRLELQLAAIEGRKTFDTYLLTPETWGTDTFMFLRPTVTPSAEALDELGADYLVINGSDSPDYARSLKEQMRGRLEPAAAFNPYRVGADAVLVDPYASTAAPHLLRDYLQRRSLGPRIEVYRIRR